MANSAPSPRPLSPHLQIWRFTVTMAASITHRGTGVALYGGTLLLGGWVILLSTGSDLAGALADFIRSPIGVVIVAGYVWSLSFHLLNGLRHLYWDTGRGLAPATASKTAWAVYVGSIILAAIIVVSGVSAWGN